MHLSRFALVFGLSISLPAQALLQPSAPPPDPGINGETTLEGIDTNNNGVRDDLEVAIFASYPNNIDAREILYQMAIYYQTLLIYNQTSNVVLDSIGYLTALAPCLEAVTGTPSVGDSMLRPNVLNTYDRSVAYINAMAVMDNAVTIPTRTVSCTALPTYPVVPPSVPNSITIPQSSEIFTYPISWEASIGTVLRYELQQDINAGFVAPATIYSGTALSSDVTVSKNGTYYYRVRACGNTACSNFRSGTNGIAVNVQPPSRPSAITVPDSSINTPNGSHTVSWTTATGLVTRYELQRDISNSFATPTIVYSGNGLFLNATVAKDGTYYYRVRACNSVGCSEYTTASNGILIQLLPFPGMPSAIYVPTLVPFLSSYEVRWQAASGTVDRYDLEEASVRSLGINPSSWQIIYAGTRLSFILPGKSRPQADRQYFYYGVRACNARGCSDYRVSTEPLVFQ